MKEEEKGMIWPSQNCEKGSSSPKYALMQLVAPAAVCYSSAVHRFRWQNARSLSEIYASIYTPACPVNGARSTCAFGNLKIAFLASGPPARFSIGHGTVEHRSPGRGRVSLTHPLRLPGWIRLSTLMTRVSADAFPISKLGQVPTSERKRERERLSKLFCESKWTMNGEC